MQYGRDSERCERRGGLVLTARASIDHYLDVGWYSGGCWHCPLRLFNYMDPGVPLMKNVCAL